MKRHRFLESSRPRSGLLLQMSHGGFSPLSAGQISGNYLLPEIVQKIAAGLRKLKPLRKQLPLVLETALSPLTEGGNGEAQSLRVMHLEAISQLSRRHNVRELSPVALQIYWSLYTGLLSFWSNDKSPRQEDTLALLDHSMEMFVGWLKTQSQ